MFNNHDYINGEIVVYNIFGQEIIKKPLENISLNKFSIVCSPGYYIVKVITQNTTISEEVFIK